MKNYNLKRNMRVILIINNRNVIYSMHEIAGFYNGQVNGKRVVYNQNGKKQIISEFKNNKLHGRWIMYHEDGRKQWERDYQNNKLHGYNIGYYSNGDICIIHEFKNNRYVKRLLIHELTMSEFNSIRNRN